MCKLHGYQYACGHFVRYRFSRCRGTYTKTRRRRLKDKDDPDDVRVVACIGECYLAIKSPHPCGSCLHEEFKRQWDARIGEAETAYREALDRGVKIGLGLWGWGVGGGVDDDEDGDDDDGSDGDEGAAEKGGAEDGTTVDKGRWDGKQSRRRRRGEKDAIKEEIDYRARVLDDLRSDFSADSWTVRTRFPPTGRQRYPGPLINKRVPHGSSPLRCEVYPEDVVLKERGRGGDGGQQRYMTFQAFFIDTYGGPSSDSSWNDRTAEVGGEDWTAGGNGTQMGQMGTMGAWDSNVLANINLANSLKEGEQEEATGDESYYTEYNRFDVTNPKGDEPEVEDVAKCKLGTEEVNKSDENKIPMAQKPKGSAIAYGSKATYPPISSPHHMYQEHILAPGPSAVLP
ncbi:hypothetical protein SLS56_009562 [Neofusicoccum ribis]|uniref:Uncharacterized protein n=1 Tax=Neofusicoccum ribis TaxID=45134 RepID=A0ABR3SHH4_9PEZI